MQIFKDLDVHCPSKTILASNTSSISITQIAAVTKRADKVIGMHFMNPVPVMKLVEVIRGYQHPIKCAEQSWPSQQLGKIPTEVNDFPGFVANKILMPMINEAIITLNEGVAGVEEIDTVMKLGMAHPMGPLQLADFIGLDVCLNNFTCASGWFWKSKRCSMSFISEYGNSRALRSKIRKRILRLLRKQKSRKGISPI